MRLLLDTHIAVWYVAANHRLSAEIRALIDNTENDVFVSAVNIWEIAIKHALARGRPHEIGMSAHDAIARFAEADLDMLPVSAAHAAAVANLPLLHADPFDRLLLAQAVTEPLRLLTRDTKVLAYGTVTLAA
jgi:PIN domain nuclease of toxin-antitoxin system